MSVVQAVLVVRQHIDDAALGDAPFRTRLNHMLDFGL